MTYNVIGVVRTRKNAL